MSPQPLWKDCQAALEQLLQTTESLQQSAIDAVSSGQADVYAQSCAQLAQSLHAIQPELAQAFKLHGQPPADLQKLLQRIGQNLQGLQEINTRQDAAARRALGVLFPADQVKEYSRLGARLGTYGPGQRSGGSTYIKA